MLFDHHKQDHHRDRGQERRGKQILPLDHVERRKLRDAHRDGTIVCGRDQNRRDRILVPCVNEHKDQRRDDARSRHGQKDRDQ